MKAIDVHSHMSTAPYTYEARYGKEVAEALKTYYRVKEVIRTEEEMAKEFIDLDVKALIIAWDSETVTGLPPVTNDYVAKVAKDYPDAFLGADLGAESAKRAPCHVELHFPCIRYVLNGH